LQKISYIYMCVCVYNIFLYRFEIEGKPHTLEFTDALQTVLLNGRPFKVEFGGLPKPIIVRDKKHFIRFSVLPRGVRAGHVKISGMRGEDPVESPPTTPLIAQKPKVDAASAPSQAPAVEQESTSQDDSDFTSTSKPGKTQSYHHIYILHLYFIIFLI